MASLHCFLGYPEPDAGVPFAFWISLDSDALLIAGVMNRGTTGIVDLESERVPSLSNNHIHAHMTQNGLHPVNPTHCIWWVEQQLNRDTLQIFEEWEIIKMLAPLGVEPTYHFQNDGMYNPALASQTAEMVHPETGVFFPLPESVLSEGVKGVAVAVKNDTAVQGDLIEAVVEACADMAMDEDYIVGVRLYWTTALEALEMVYDGQENLVTRDVVEHNRRAIVLGASGSQIPFVKVWTHQQLVNSVAIAQLMSRKG